VAQFCAERKKAEKCVLVGYSSFKKGYKLFSLERKQFVFSRDVNFFEQVFPFKIKHGPVEKQSQDLDHVNFFDEIIYEGSDTPNDDNNLNAQAQNKVATLLKLAIQLLTFLRMMWGHPQGSNGSASENEMAATSKHGSALSENENSNKSLGRDSKGRIIILLPVSFEEHVAVQRDTKARTLLLQSLLEDHMADFHHLDDAREIWLAVKARFGGNGESKKMRKTMLKQAFSEFSVFEEEGLHKVYDRALPLSWSQVALTLKTRGGLEYLDDLYSKLRSLEIDVKGGSSYGSRSTTVAPTHSSFIGAASTNTKMVYSDQPSYSSLISYTLAPSEVEYHGVANDVAETYCLRNLLRELHTPMFFATLVYCDNVSAVYLILNPVQHQRMKHIEIDIHFV
nr:ribonuclease H-like domain-containing protein [Tanacetum cinerariifolium]